MRRKSMTDNSEFGSSNLLVPLFAFKGRPPQIIIHDSVLATNNRYLELADLALGNGKPKKKSKGAASND